MKISIKDFFSKCDQIRSFLRIWSHLVKKSLMEIFIFVQCCNNQLNSKRLPFSLTIIAQHLVSQMKCDFPIFFQIRCLFTLTLIANIYFRFRFGS